MAADDIRAQVEAWIGDEISKQCLGGDYGFAVAWGPVPVQSPAGAVVVAVWTAVLTARNPMVGETDLYHLAQLGATRPREEDVRREVSEGLRMLRDLARSKVGGLNGHARRRVPG